MAQPLLCLQMLKIVELEYGIQCQCREQTMHLCDRHPSKRLCMYDKNNYINY